MKPALQHHLSQQLAMTPQLQKAIRLLQLSAQELITEMQLALESNPLLEINEDEYDFFEHTLNTSNHNERNAIDAAIENALSQEENTLQAHLLWQINLMPMSETERWVATYIVDSINEDGFIEGCFKTLMDDIQTTCEVSTKVIELVLKRIQQCDPIGVGARDLRECLLLQIAAFSPDMPFVSKARIVIENYLGLLAKRDFTTLKKRLGTTAQNLSDIIAFIQTLHPRPGTQIGQCIESYSMPDLTATHHHQHWEVALNPRSQLPLRISHFYSQQLQPKNGHDARYIKQQLQEAHWFLNSIEHRNQTLLKVGRYLIEYQAPFVVLGDEALKPLDLTQVAQHLNMHESTISRITMQKTIETPRGLLELKSFFSNRMIMAQGEVCSTGAIRALLRKIIASESPVKPLSDARLSQALRFQGISVARRTIAKYRETLCIPPAHERKQMC